MMPLPFRRLLSLAAGVWLCAFAAAQSPPSLSEAAKLFRDKKYAEAQAMLAALAAKDEGCSPRLWSLWTEACEAERKWEAFDAALPGAKDACLPYASALRALSRGDKEAVHGHFVSALSTDTVSLGFMYELAGQFQRRKMLDEGAAVFQDALETRPFSPIYLGAGLLKKAQGRPMDALFYFQKAADAWETSRPLAATEAEHGDFLGAPLHESAAIHYEKGEYEPALDAWKRLRELVESQGRTDRLGGLLNNMSMAARALGRLDEAAGYLERALTINEAGGNAGAMASSLTNLGLLHFSRGDFGSSRACHERARRLYEESGDKRGEANACINLALLEGAAGRYEETVPLYDRAMETFRALDDKAGMARVHNNAGITLRVTSRYDEALKRFEEAFRLGRGTGSKDLQATALYNVAFVKAALGQYEKSLKIYAAVLRLQEEMGSRLEAAVTRTSMAILHLDAGRPAEALALLQNSLKTYGELGAHSDRARALVQLGRAQRALGRRREAAEALREAAEICRSRNVNPYAINWALVHLSATEAERGRKHAALEAAAEALRREMGSLQPTPDGLYRAHAAMARARELSREHEEASENFRAALEVIEDVRSALHEQGQRMSYLEKQISLYEDYAALLLGSRKRRAANAAEAFAAGERMKARAFLDELGAARFARVGLPPELMERHRSLEAEIRQLRKRLETPSTSP